MMPVQHHPTPQKSALNAFDMKVLKMKGLESYIVIIVLAGIIISGIFLLIISGALTGKNSIPASMSAELSKFRSDGCGSDADCKGNGVCVSARCLCFEASQCQVGCDKSVGKCK